MILHILTYEWKKLLRKPESTLIALAFALLIGTAFLMAGREVNAQQELIAAETAEIQMKRMEVEQRLRGIEQNPELAPAERNPRVPFELGGRQAAHHIFKRPEPLAALALGHSKLFPHAYPVSVSNTQLFSPMMEDNQLAHPLSFIFPEMDLAFVLIWLLPFWVIASCYQIRSWEQEHGTLSLLRAQPIGLGKLLGLKVLFHCSLISVFCCGTIALLAVFQGMPFSGQGASWLLLFGMITAYTFFWGLLALAVSRLRLSSAVNAGLLFTAWLTIVIVIPALIHLRADQAFPLPSRMELVHEMRETEVNLSKNINSEMEAFYMDHPELAPTDAENKMPYWHYQLALKKQRAADLYQPVIEAYYNSSTARISWLNKWQFASPAIVFQRKLNAISGNAHEDYLAFQQGADAANAAWREIFFEKILKDEWMQVHEFTSLPNFSKSTTMLLSLR